MKVRFVSPWYPDYAAIHSGIFVAKQVEALRASGVEVVVDVPSVFPAPPGPIPETVAEAVRELASKSLDSMFHAEDGVRYVPTPVPSRGGPLGRAEAMARSLGLLAEYVHDDSEVVHAHVGMPAGWAVSQVVGDKPLVLTEHWSGLGAALNEPLVASAYSDLLRRADAFICVSPYLRNQIVNALGSWAVEKIEVIPNIVDLTDITFRDRAPFQFRSWVYVGGLMPHKGVQPLVRAFSEYKKTHDPEAKLTLVGEGPLRRWIDLFAATRGLEGSVTLTGSVEHSDLGKYLDAADVMVHLSPVETFGIASLEGIGAGLPVVSLANDGAVSAWGEIEEQCGQLLKIETSPKDIATAVAALRSAPDRLDLRAGRRVVEQRFSAAVVSRRLRALYRQVLR